MVTMPEVFSGNRIMTAQLAPHEESAREKQDIVLEKFTEHLQKSRAYLNQDVTISDIGEIIGIPVHQLSKALNLGLKKNFYQCINEYRVEEAKRLLTDERLDDRSVLMIGLEAGFNSKSTFNDVFKKIAGLTPSEYRKAEKNFKSPS
jgi:AraC-like DNA-binding protein